MPISEGGQFRVHALITKEMDGEMREHKLIRADMCASQQEAADLAIFKSKQMIDQLGDGIQIIAVL